jgi:hypothetical protein
MDGEKIGQGKEAVIDYLREHIEVQEKIRKVVLEKVLS